MHRVRDLGLDDTTTQQCFEIFGRVMSDFAAQREEYASHAGLRNVVAVAILEMAQDGERNLQLVEFHAVSSGRAYLKKLGL